MFNVNCGFQALCWADLPRGYVMRSFCKFQANRKRLNVHERPPLAEITNKNEEVYQDIFVEVGSESSFDMNSKCGGLVIVVYVISIINVGGVHFHVIALFFDIGVLVQSSFF